MNDNHPDSGGSLHSGDGLQAASVRPKVLEADQRVQKVGICGEQLSISE